MDLRSGKQYYEFVDMDLLVKKYLVEEVVKIFYANRTSLYFYKPPDKDSLLAFAGSVWEVEAGKDYAENIEYIRVFFEARMAFLNESWPLK